METRFFTSLMCLLILLSNSVRADWSDTFLEGVNNIDSLGEMRTNTSFIINAPTNGQLPTHNYIQGGDAAAKLCVPANGNAKDCKAGNYVATLPLNRLDFAQCESSSTENIGPPEWDNKTIQVDEGEYQNITIGNGGDRTIEFISSNTEGFYKIKSLTGNSGNIIFSPGQYWVESLSLGDGVNITLPASGAVSFFIKNDYSHTNWGLNNNPEQLLFYSYGNFSMQGSSSLEAYVVAEGNADIAGSAALTGAITASNISMGGSSSVTFDDTADQISVVPSCSSSAAPFHIQYGKATSTSVTFDDAFPTGVTPLVFIMSTISETNSLTTDGPQSAFLSNISETGFTWARQEPPGNIVSSVDMPEVHWVAVTPGTHDLSNGTQLIAGSVEYDLALIGANNNYISVTMDASQDVLLNQMQTSNNDCWLTSTSQFNNTGIELAMDTSEVRNNSAECQPAGLSNGNLHNETIAYMTVASGSGALILNGEDLNYHFGNSQTFFNTTGIRDVEYQCSVTTPLTGFTDVPILVAGKTNRRGGDGGWLRRCQLTNDLVSMVVDEDTYRDNDRRHIWENYSFFALERTEPVSQCFTDDFNRTSLGSDWVAASSSGSFTPSIVSNKLRLTQAAGNQATSTTYQRLFPAADNLIEIEFDHSAYDGNGADGIAMVFSDASITPQPGAAGGPLGYGYKPSIDGFAGGWLGIGIDEYGNFSAEGGDNNIGRRQQSVSIRGSGSGTSGYPYLRGTCNNGTTNTTGDCLTPPVDNNENDNHRYRIVIDSRVSGQSLVSVSRDTGSGFVEIVPQFDILSFASQAAVPDDFILSITGSTGGSTNVHEIDDIEFCALDSSPVGVVIDHFEFTHTGSALTCNAEPMTLTACANADCTQTVPDFVTATLSPATIATGGGWVGGNVVSFSGGSTNLSLRNNTAGSVTVDVTGSTPGAKPFSSTKCSVAGSTPTAEQCTFNFADSGFIFTVPDKLANKPSGAISISAVKKDTETLECTPQFENVTKSVGFWSDYVNPSSVISASSVSVTGTGAATDIGTSIGARTPIALQFDASGIAEFEVNYPDAGAIQLNAQYDGTGEEDGLVMVGADPFVSFPVGLCVNPVDTNASCASGNSSCDVYKKAGEDFDLSVQAMAWESDSDTDYCDNLTTPNYVHAGIVLGSNLVAPNPGETGTLGLGNYDHVAAINNQNTITQSVSEVGVFEFTVKAPSEYLGSTFYDIPQASSGNIGRFIPDRFVVSSVSVLPACGVFNYMGQPFSMAMNITAFNIGSEVTKNYQDAFAYATGILVGENSDDGDDKRNRMSALPVSASSWVAGVATVESSYMASLSRTTAPSQDGPFEDFDIGLIVVDNDGDNSFVSDPDMNAATSGTCGSNCDAKLLSNQRFRHGRVVMDNTYGAENDTLQMPTRAEYWNGLAWVTNTDDSCSVVTPALASQVDDLSLGYKFEPSLTTGQLIDRTGQTGSFSNGEFTLLWNAIITGSAADYRGQVTAPLIVPEWLQWYWNWENASSTTLYDPRASAYFGRYRGHDRIIYWREKR
ncbi:MSHA biogenesis protein MshQ [Shewanella sp. 10N.7]|uniref:DUF6701 domain-containing protein n=1 Tax=Shewanella sp. 10N.7 TaxID=2885093 RepID=UPI001E3840CE|nr:DUF6701 domain-containing protein [Shewanella sp. 10N.7]MCC4832989.1 MSHA biogenesis protein MshQ [Shewanella sp. 10N.7]